MKISKILALFTAVAALTAWSFAADAPASVSTTLSGVHICCGSCVKGVNAIVGTVSGVTGTPSQADKTIALTAPDKATLQKAVDALVAAGFYGASSNADIKVINTTGAKDATVTTTDVKQIHLCCGSCATTLNTVAKGVSGVTGTNAAQGGTSFTVTGSYNQKALFDALNKAGFAASVKS